MRYLSKSCLLLTIALAAIASPALALPDDKEQPINIQSDKAEQSSSKKGEVTIYTGTVLMEQGSMRLEGDMVTIYSKNRSVNKVVAIGKPARFQQQSDINESPIKAHGNRIIYNINQETIVLLDNAGINQDDSTVQGQRIVYNVTTEQVKAKGTADKSTRVHMVLEPSKKPRDDDKEEHGNPDSE